MTITLRPVTKDNYEAVCDLEVTKKQEDYVACNMWSIVESKFNDNYTTRAIYQQQTLVGFFMWVLENPTMISIWRFMVDKQFQKQGIGRQAMNLAIEEIKQTEGVKQIEICYDPENPVAKNFYASFGFVEVGMDEDDEDMLALMPV